MGVLSPGRFLSIVGHPMAGDMECVFVSPLVSLTWLLKLPVLSHVGCTLVTLSNLNHCPKGALLVRLNCHPLNNEDLTIMSFLE